MSWKCKNCGHISVERPAKCSYCGKSKFRKVWKVRTRGRPKKKDGQDKLIEILKLLPEDGSKIQAKELKQRAHNQKISPNTLFDYLRILEDNFQVIKEVDVPAKPPKVYYKRITEEEFFGKELFLKNQAYLERGWSIAEKLSKTGEELEPLKKSVLVAYLLLFTGYLTKIGSKAREIKDVNKRKEFIDITTRIHLLPNLLKLSSLGYFEPKDWGSGLGAVREMMQKSKESFGSEIKKIIRPYGLPSSLSGLERFDKLTTKEIENLMKVVEEMLKGGGNDER
jgi:hypothetical protein